MVVIGPENGTIPGACMAFHTCSMSLEEEQEIHEGVTDRHRSGSILGVTPQSHPKRWVGPTLRQPATRLARDPDDLQHLDELALPAPHLLSCKAGRLIHTRGTFPLHKWGGATYERIRPSLGS